VTAPTYKNLQAEIDEADSDILAYETQIARCQVKSRYLKHLGDKEQQGTEEEMRDDCIICLGSSDDAHGILLPCGHFFCVVSFSSGIGMVAKCLVVL
jgi:E3 ubiquitin-protein ligase SHPRH